MKLQPLLAALSVKYCTWYKQKQNHKTYAIGSFVSYIGKEASAKNINVNKTSSTGHLHHVYTDRTDAKQP